MKLLLITSDDIAEREALHKIMELKTRDKDWDHKFHAERGDFYLQRKHRYNPIFLHTMFANGHFTNTTLCGQDVLGFLTAETSSYQVVSLFHNEMPLERQLTKRSVNHLSGSEILLNATCNHYS